MATRTFFTISLLVASLAFVFYRPPTTQYSPPDVGRNNTILFIPNNEGGLANVFVAAAVTLLEKHPHVEIHVASFAPLRSQLERVSSFARRRYGTKDIVFHELRGKPALFASALAGNITSMEDVMHRPATPGIDAVCAYMQLFFSPWTIDEHMDLYQQVERIIGKVDPAVVVPSTFMRPALQAVQANNRLHSILSPNHPIDNFLTLQPWGSYMWKYPALGSGFAFPVPWRNVVENIYLNIRYIYAVYYMPMHRAKDRLLRAQGIQSLNWLNLYRPDAPWIDPSMPGASIPVDFIPPNVTRAGPITFTLGSVEEQSSELAAWLAQGPTILINLGSLFTYTEDRARYFATAISRILAEKSNVQILWKFTREQGGIGSTYGDDVLEPLHSYLKADRLRMEKWLDVDPSALLESGHIIASVHHGGAGCYHEAIATGVLQIVLPVWLDLYNYAQMVEDIGVGVWGCRETSPHWTSDCLYVALDKVVDGDAALTMRQNAKRLGDRAAASPGRYIAAGVLAKLAGSGRAE